MNTEGEKIQWHPAFDAALQIELGEEAKYLTFEPEHLLSKKPMQIDVLVKNEKKVKIRKNIGRIFRQHNIIEYKSPEDHLNIDDFYKVYGYTLQEYRPDTRMYLQNGSRESEPDSSRRTDDYVCVLSLSAANVTKSSE